MKDFSRPQWLQNIDSVIEGRFLNIKHLIFLWLLGLLGLTGSITFLVQIGVLIYQSSVYINQGFWPIFTYHYNFDLEVHTSLLGLNKIINHMLDWPVFASTLALGICLSISFGLILYFLFHGVHFCYRFIRILIFFWWDAPH